MDKDDCFYEDQNQAKLSIILLGIHKNVLFLKYRNNLNKIKVIKAVLSGVKRVLSESSREFSLMK